MTTGRRVPFHGFDPRNHVDTTRRRLPHWRQTEVTYFVTFRLADSVPQPLLHKWRDERAIWMRLHPPPWRSDEEREYKQRFTNRMQEWLDAGMGACQLRRRNVRAQVELCLLHFDGIRYDIDALVLMPKPCSPANQTGCWPRSRNGVASDQGSQCQPVQSIARPQISILDG